MDNVIKKYIKIYTYIIKYFVNNCIEIFDCHVITKCFKNIGTNERYYPRIKP